VSKGLLATIAVGCVLAAARPADAGCDEADAAARTTKIRALLDGEAKRARRWNLAWGIGFGTVAAGQFGLTLADYTPLGDYDDDKEVGLYFAAGKAALGSLAHVVLPLKIVRPGPLTGDACADLDAAERALRASGRNEQRSFYLNHLGAFAMNAGSLLLLGMVFDTWREGWLGLAIGYPVGLLHAYTQPRRAWRWARRLPDDVSVTVVRNEDAWGLAIGGAF